MIYHLLEVQNIVLCAAISIVYRDQQRHKKITPEPKTIIEVLLSRHNFSHIFFP